MKRRILLELRVPPLAIVVIVAALMWMLAAVPLQRFNFPGQVGLTCAFAIVGLAVAAAGVLQFRRAKTTVNPMTPGKSSSLVVGGVYTRTRNPMYLGFALWLVGLAVYLGHPVSVLGVPLFVIYMNRFQIEPEERALEARFGEEFQRYCDNVRRWL